MENNVQPVLTKKQNSWMVIKFILFSASAGIIQFGSFTLLNEYIHLDKYTRLDELLGNDYEEIAKSMTNGIGFFNPGFNGSKEESLRWIVDNQLSPSPLGRQAFAEKALENAVSIGARQYLIMGAGYDTFAYRQPTWAKNLFIFEVDHKETAKDKQKRISNAGIIIPSNINYVTADFTDKHWISNLICNNCFDSKKISFYSLLGLLYYISEDVFSNMLMEISSVSPKGSTIVFDYPDDLTHTDKNGQQTEKQLSLANKAKEKMIAGYSYKDIERILSKCGFLIYEHLTPQEITNQYFEEYNSFNSEHKMKAFDNVNYCLAVKQ